MELATHRLTLDVRRKDAQGEMRVKKEDNARRLVFELVDGSAPYEPGEGVSARIYADLGESIAYYDCALEGSRVSCDLPGGLTASVGVVECEVRLVSTVDERLLTSPRFRLIVDDTLYDDEAVEAAAGTDLGVLDELIGDSEAWAVGERGGVPVGSSDETYHNNAKWYSGLSEGWMQNAANFAAQAGRAVPVVYGEPEAVVHVVYCTQEQYDGMASHDANTDYRIYEE